ncbi:MAG: YebC/PmpR family DNA-binding transcriptional regulator [Candidatus Moranbacteria bacterium]|nr:YebC/PmpR family DNA-binding transcriptional regulator [Candidatus Moranbacteria bacterium]
MSGHSKWSNIKHRKQAQDAKKAKIFSFLSKEIILAARNGGDPETNFQLKMAMDKARSYNMPKDNVEKAIKRGTGELKDENQIEEYIFDAYGPGQTAMLIKTASDNKNRTLNEVKNILTKNGGKLVEEGSVRWQFKQVGSILIAGSEKSEEQLEEAIIESPVEDYRKNEDGSYYVFTQPANTQAACERLKDGGVEVKEMELVYLPENTIEIDENTKIDYENLLEKLDEQEDVVEIFDNLA